MVTIPVLPQSAPFTNAQRAWLNGYFAGLLSRTPGSDAMASAPMPAMPGMEMPSTLSAPSEPAEVEEEDGEMPWHDPAMGMEERLELAKGKSPKRALMAAMAQLDCGACGYVCQTYSEAIASGEEKDLTKCSPGGRETAKKLKELVALTVNGATQAAPAAAPVVKPSTPANVAATSPALVKYDRRNPFPARLLRCQTLNAPGSSKDTRLVCFDLHGSSLTYKAGDALGVVPENCPDNVGWLIEALDASGAEAVKAPDGSDISLHEALLRHYAITTPASDLVKLLADSTADADHKKALLELADEDGAGVPEGIEILDLLTQYPSARPKAAAFVSALLPIRARLYSISSSPKMYPDEVHLTVGVVRYLNKNNRQCKGVASTFLSERIKPGQKVKVFVQPSHGFAPPADGSVPAIMVGPGTGIAPFRAFLQDRAADGDKGRNWLFFGDQRKDQDFLYKDELEDWLLDGTLTRLDTAFSRDQAEKVYVQTRMLEKAREIWAWLQDGAHFYVCGDAKRMAKDVDNALKQIVAEQGGMTPEAAAAYVTDLSKSKRYQRDVY